MRRSAQPASSEATIRVRRLFSAREWLEVGRELRLSERELEIVRLCVDDLKEETIAQRLAISGHTVHTHMERLHHKLGVGSRAALLVRVFATWRAMTGSLAGERRMREASAGRLTAE